MIGSNIYHVIILIAFVGSMRGIYESMRGRNGGLYIVIYNKVWLTFTGWVFGYFEDGVLVVNNDLMMTKGFYGATHCN